MAHNLFSAQLRWVAPSPAHVHPIVVIDLAGEVSSEADDPLNAAYIAASNAAPAAIVLNFGAVSYINSIGIALIVRLMAQAHVAGRSLLVYGLSEHYVEVFQITRLASYMQLFPDEASALASVTA